MANTYSQMYLQFVFAVKYRESLIQLAWKEDLYRYITGVVQNNKHKVIAINGMPNHLHLFVGYKPHQSIPDLLQDIKWSSSHWINNKNLVEGQFRWQEGYGSFSYSQSHIDRVVKYILNQEQHHKQKSFRKEYIQLLKKFNVEYDERYILQEIQ